jgi:hypothetical protein
MKTLPRFAAFPGSAFPGSGNERMKPAHKPARTAADGTPKIDTVP